MVNDYLRETMGIEKGATEGFTAKDFRTWGATVRAVAYLATQVCEEQVSERAFNRCIAATAKDVAEALGNTAAVCRKSYINPVVFTAWRSKLIESIVPRTRVPPRRLEKLTLKVLKRAKRMAKA
jgi:DNA topoisomerase IB